MSAWRNDFIKLNRYSRPGDKLVGVKKLIAHYTANPGASASNHQKYFNNLTGRYASAHLFVDKIEAICILPLDEIAYHCNDIQRYVNGKPYRGISELLPNANFRSIGVEICIEKDGTFHPDTLKRAERVFAELCKMFDLDPKEDIVRHYDHTSKNCPAPWVSNPSDFTEFKLNVDKILNPPKPQPVVKQSAPEQTWKIVKVISSEFGIYSAPKTDWKEDSKKYEGWIFVARKKQVIGDTTWYELFLGDNSYGWISGNQVEAVEFKWAIIKEKTTSYVHSDMKVKCADLSEGAKIAVLQEFEDKYLIVSSSRPQWVSKTLVQL